MRILQVSSARTFGGGETHVLELVEALRKQRVEFEQLIFPDEVHDFLTHERWLRAYHAAAEFLKKKLL